MRGGGCGGGGFVGSAVGVGKAVGMVVGVSVGGTRVGRRVAVAVNVGVAVEVAVAVGVGVGVLVAVAVAVSVAVAVAVNVVVGVAVATLAPGAGTSPAVELFNRLLIMMPAAKAISATKTSAKGIRHDRRLAGVDRTGGAINAEADAAFINTAGDAAANDLSVGIAPSSASNNSSALLYRSAGVRARHFCTICSSRSVIAGFQRRRDGGVRFICSHNTLSRVVPAPSPISPVNGLSPPVSISNKTMPSA